MRKIALAFSALIVILGLSACTQAKAQPQPQPYTDGTYYAQDQEFDDGWKNAVTIVIEDGKIVEVEWNSFNESGQDKKTLSRDGQYDMTVAGANAQWHEQAEAMERALIDKQDVSDITVDEEGYTDAVSSVTIHVSEFLNLANKALSQASK